MKLPTSTFWPLTPGSYINYSAGLITGGFNAATGELNIGTRIPDPNQGLFRRTVVKLPQGHAPEVAIVHSTPPVVPTVDMDWQQAAPLYQMLWDDGVSVPYIGESGSDRSFGIPPDPILTMNPKAGETFTVQIAGASYDLVTGKAFKEILTAKYRTIAVGFQWWQYQNCVRTSNEERPGTTGAGHNAFNWVFAPGIGIIDHWGATIAADGTIVPGTGYAWKIESYG